MGGGVIDENYRDNIGVILFKFDDSDFVISIGDRISPLVVERISTLVIMEGAMVDVTARHNNAFGSISFLFPSIAFMESFLWKVSYWTFRSRLYKGYFVQD